jgi:hypothetical protein
MPQSLPKPIQTLEQIDRERFELFSLAPLSGIAPMALGDPDLRGEALALFAKWVAIQRMHGAKDSDLTEFALNYIGLGGKAGQAVVSKTGELAEAVIAIARNMLVACERLQAGHSVPEVQEMCKTKGKLTPDVVAPFMLRAQELVQYSRDTGIGPFDFERRRAKSADAGAGVPCKEAWMLAFERLAMGHSDDVVEDALAQTETDLDVKRFRELWELVRRSTGKEAQIMGMVQSSSEDAEERKEREEMFTASFEALQRCREHPAFRLYESFERSTNLNAKLGCISLPIGLVVFIGLLFTPLAWWASLLLTIGLVAAIVIGRTIWAGVDVSRTISGILKTCPAGSSQYVDAYRLFSKAQEWDSCATAELKQIVSKLPAVDTAVGSADGKKEQRPAFHGFFYSNDKDGNPIRLDMSALQQQAFQKVAEGNGWQHLDEVTYWKRCYPVGPSAVGQGYLAWNGRSYWVFYTTRLDGGKKEEGVPYGVHLVEFTKDKMRYKWIETGGLGAFSGALRNLLEVICNWNIHEVGSSRAKRLSPGDVAILQKNIDWTYELHERMGAQFPDAEQTS